MMKTIVVDRSRESLEAFGSLSSEIADIHLVGQFEDDEDAVEFARSNPVDLAFLNVSLPEENGFLLATKLRAIRKNILIVFVSEDGKYILFANIMRGDYYLIKPYCKTTLEIAIERIRLIAGRLRKELYIQMFDSFMVYKAGKSINLVGKAKEILALIVSRRGKEITDAEICRTIWEGREYGSFYMTVYYNSLRRLKEILRSEGIEDLLVRTPRGYLINTALFDCDYYAWLDIDRESRAEVDKTFLPGYFWRNDVIP